MTARVLVVDDILANIKLLEARLTAEYFEVVTAMNGPEALEICARGHCDLVLLDVMMPGMDGFEVCRRLKDDPATHHIPVIMVTALDQPADRVSGLKAGADDFLTKPVSDIALITRVKSLVRIKLMTDELRSRAMTSQEIGAGEPPQRAADIPTRNGQILVVDDRESSNERIAKCLRQHHNVDIETSPQEALFRFADGKYECAIVSLGLDEFDGLRLCSQIRSLERTRNLPILVLCEPDDNSRLLRGLDLGINDYVVRPIDQNELMARVNTQVRRSRYTEKLRDNAQLSVTMAITDPLTGLHNRRYMESHLKVLLDKCLAASRPLSVLMLDIDHFKAVNDTHGHDVGDEVLREFASRMRRNVRGIDLACRMGGEEFVVVMPETDLSLAVKVGERIRQCVAEEPFVVNSGAEALDITVSVGVSAVEGAEETPETLFKRADNALYAAKRGGRNRVMADAA